MSGVSHSFSTVLPIPCIILARLRGSTPEFGKYHLRSKSIFRRYVIAQAADQRGFSGHTNHLAGMRVDIHVDNPSGRVQQNRNDQCNVTLTQDQPLFAPSRSVEELRPVWRRPRNCGTGQPEFCGLNSLARPRIRAWRIPSVPARRANRTRSVPSLLPPGSSPRRRAACRYGFAKRSSWQLPAPGSAMRKIG